MKNRISMMLALAALVSLGAWSVQAQASKKGPGIPGFRCPITGETANLAVKLATDDGPVFFCCAGCIPKYKANPAKYASQVAAQRMVLSKRPKVQVKCPLSGETIDGTTSIKYEGKRVQFCCKKCIKAFQQNPSKFKAALANSFTYQAKCPVSGEEIDPEVVATSAGGHKVYFCCGKCKKKFLQDPSPFQASLAAQGLMLEPSEWKGAASHKEMHHGHHGEGEGHHEGHGH